MALQWNTDDAYGPQRQQQAEQGARALAQQRSALAADLGYWREVQRQLGPALEAAVAERDRAEAEKDRAWARYVVRYHALQRGSTPRQGSSPQVVVLTPWDGMHPDTLANWPARAEHTAFTRATQALQEATNRVLQLERDTVAVQHNVTLCEQAARG